MAVATEKEADLFWDAPANMFDHDHSAARGKMRVRRLRTYPNNYNPQAGANQADSARKRPFRWIKLQTIKP